MRKHICLMAAAAMTVSGLSYVARADTPAPDNQPTANRPTANRPTATDTGAANTGNGLNSSTGSAQMTSGQPMGPAVSNADAASIRQVLARVTDDAVAGSSMKDLQQDFSQRDMDRLGKQDVKSDDLQKVAEEVRTAWRNKYNDDFKVKDEAVVYNDQVRILQGDYSDQARTAGERMSPSPSASSSDPSSPSSPLNNGVDKNQLGNNTHDVGTGGRENGRPEAFNPSTVRGHEPVGTSVPHTAASSAGTGRNVGGPGAARADSPTASGSSSSAASASGDVRSPMPAGDRTSATARPSSSPRARCSPTWRCRWSMKARTPTNGGSSSLPGWTRRSSTTICSRRSTMVRDHQAEWPSDENEAYRHVTHHVFAALEDVSPRSMRSGDTVTPAGSTPSHTTDLGR